MTRCAAQVKGVGTPISLSDLLALLPYGPGFLFVDEFIEADSAHTVAKYHFRGNESFYSGHFQDQPLTPGVILLESMCQSGMVAQGLYLLAHETGIDNAKRHRFLVTGSNVEWSERVHPGETVYIYSKLVAWRQHRIRTDVQMFSEGNKLLAAALISGMGVSWSIEDLSSTAVAVESKP